MRRAVSISACLILLLASFSAYFTHEHDLDASQPERHIIHSHFKLHLDVPDWVPDLGGQTGQAGKMEGSEPPAHYLDIFWLQTNAPAVLPAFAASQTVKLPSPAPSYIATCESLELTGYRGPPFEDPRGLRSPPSNSLL